MKKEFAYFRVLFWLFLFVQPQYSWLVISLTLVILFTYDIQKLRFSNTFLFSLPLISFLLLLHVNGDVRILYAFLGIVFSPFIVDDLVQIEKSQKILLSPLLLILFLLVLSINYTGQRFRFILGPNMLYRLVLLSYILVKIKGNIKYILDFLVLLLIVSIGSRGGMVLLLSIWLVRLVGRIGIARSFFMLSLMFLPFVVYFYELFRIYLGRVLFFSIENNSEAYRFGSYSKWLEWLNMDNFLDLVFGSGFATPPFDILYPHNFLLEISHSMGLLFAIIFLIIFLRNVKLSTEMKLVLFFPALLSGNVVDNYFLFSLL